MGKKFKKTLNMMIIMCIMMTTPACSSSAAIFEKDETFIYESMPSEKDNFSFAQFSIWCPENIKTYKGILYLGAGYEYSSIPFMEEEVWRDLAREHEFILLTSHMKNHVDAEFEKTYSQAAHGSGQEMLNSLKYFAKESKHPEIEHASIAMWGFSAGAQFSYNFACWKPERVITIVAVKGGYYFPEPNKEMLRIPALFLTGENDMQVRKDVVNELFEKNIKDQPLWCLANEPDAGHEVGRTDELAFPWLKELIKQRLPQDKNSMNTPIKLKELDPSFVWLGDRTTGEIAAILDYKNDQKNSSWLPNEEIAELWKNFHLKSVND